MIQIKIDKRYYQELVEQLSKMLLKDKNKLAQELNKKLKSYNCYGIGYDNKYTKIEMRFIDLGSDTNAKD